MSEPRPVLSSVAGLVVGGVLLVIMTSLLTAAAFSFSADDKAGEAISRLETLYYAEKKRNEEAEERASASAARGKKIIALAESLRRELRLTKRQLAALAEFLRDQGIDFPVIEPPPPEKASDPKGQPGSGPGSQPSAPASPEPTSPSPASPADLACALLPPLCDGLTTGWLPLLPKE